MAKLGISTGVNPNDGLGDTLLSGAIKINSNFNEIYSAIGNGVSITNSIEYATIAGFATAAGISSQVSSTININTSGIITASKIVAGGPSTFTEDLLVEGDLRVSGILTVGNSSVIIDGDTNSINVGTGVTIEGNSGVIRASEFYADSIQVGIGTTLPTSKLTVMGGDLSVGMDNSHGIILTSPNGTPYRLIIDDNGILSTVIV